MRFLRVYPLSYISHSTKAAEGEGKVTSIYIRGFNITGAKAEIVCVSKNARSIIGASQSPIISIEPGNL